MHRAALIVEPNSTFSSHLAQVVQESGWEAFACLTFEDARRELARQPVDLLVSALRLGQYNGLQLAYLVKAQTPESTVVVYGSDTDLGAAIEAQQAGAFYERRSFVPFALQGYLGAALPARDRRDALHPDRRTTFRGGRRATDLAFLHASLYS